MDISRYPPSVPLNLFLFPSALFEFVAAEGEAAVTVGWRPATAIGGACRGCSEGEGSRAILPEQVAAAIAVKGCDGTHLASSRGTATYLR